MMYMSRHRRRDSNTKPSKSAQASGQGKMTPDTVRRLGIVTEKPMFPQYSRLTGRLNSFKNYSGDNLPDIQTLAEAGFCYTGNGDAVRCYYCGCVLVSWTNDMCPYTQHAFARKDCPHLINCRGVHFETPEYNNRRDCTPPNPMDIVMTKNDVAVQTLNEFGKSDQLCKMALQKLIETSNKDVFTAIELLTVIEEIEAESANECCFKGSNYDDVCSPVNEPLDSNSVQFEELQEENERLKEALQCRICMDRTACIIFLPCGHMVACPQCGPALTVCAVCRKEIKGTVRATLVPF